MDVPERWSGYIHYAVLVDNLQEVLDWHEREGVMITEGPVVYGDRRTVAFIRDPDANVIEFDGLLPDGQGVVARWLSFAANEVHYELNLARVHFLRRRGQTAVQCHVTCNAARLTVRHHQPRPSLRR